MAFGLLSQYARFFRYIGPNTIIRKTSDTEVAFLNIETDFREAHENQETEALASEGINIPTYTVYGNTLNFSRDNYITGINVIGQDDKKMLFWTDDRIIYRNETCQSDASFEQCAEYPRGSGQRFQYRTNGEASGAYCDPRDYPLDDNPTQTCEFVQTQSIERLNEPRKINIEKFKSADQTRFREGVRFAETNFPRMATYDPKFLEEEISVIKKHPGGSANIAGDNTNREFSLDFSWVDITDYEYLACQDSTGLTCKDSRQYTYNGAVPIDQATCTGDNATNDGCYCNPSVVTSNCFTVITEDGEENFNDANRIFADAYPRFSFRWKYDDGEYSPIAPFTNNAFVPATNFIQEIRRYSEGENIAMTNAVLSLTINNIPRGGTDVVAIDILYKESITNTIYIIETINLAENLRGFGYETLNINKRSFYKALPGNQLFRPFDEVPRAAKSQEIAGNRLIYGNYLKNFEQPSEVNMVIVTQDRIDLQREGTDTNVPENRRTDQRHIKSDREYELGVVYMDKHGRQGALLTGPNSSYKTSFHYDAPQQLAVILQDDAPEWAVYYRYFIKDVSAEHYNVFAHGIWRDPIEPEFTWLQISSNDRNKIIEDGALYLKGLWIDLAAEENEHIHERSGSFIDVTTKYKREILDIQDNVPAVIRSKLEEAWNINPLYTPGTYTGLNVPYIRCAEYSATCIGWNGTASTCASTDTNQTGCGYTIAEVDGQQRRQYDMNNTNLRANYTGGPYDSNGWLQNSLGFFPDFRGNYPDARGRSPVYLPGSEIPYYPDLEGQNRYNSLGNFADGSFFVKVPTGPIAAFTDQDDETSFNLNRGDAELQEGWFGGNQSGAKDYSYWFETEPQQDESLLGLYYESGETFLVQQDLRRVNRLDWSNCIRFNGNIEERRLGGLFSSTDIGNSVRVNIPQENYELTRVFNGLIFSGLYNDAQGADVNRLNEFIVTEGITKELEPNYGSIQKLYTRDTNLIVFLEDKIFRILTDKDALYNADGDSNVTSTDAVLGQATPYQGEYGISTNPESFSQYGQNIWFTDRNRGVALQLTPSNGQIFETSSAGMNDFFRDRLKACERVIGGFDDYQDQMVLSLQGYNVNDVIDADSDQIPNDDGNQTVVYEHTNQGWVSRRSYIPDAMVTLNNRFYSWKNGQIWVHNLGFDEDNDSFKEHRFYGEPYTASVKLIFNDLPSSVKNFKTLSYEGSTGWVITQVEQGTGDGNIDYTSSVFPFVNREGKFFTPIVTMADQYGMCDPTQYGDTQVQGTASRNNPDDDFITIVENPSIPEFDFQDNIVYFLRPTIDVPQLRNLFFLGQHVYQEDDEYRVSLTNVFDINGAAVPSTEQFGHRVYLTPCGYMFPSFTIVNGQMEVSGLKGFWLTVSMAAIGTDALPQQEPLKEVFSLGSEVFISTQ